MKKITFVGLILCFIAAVSGCGNKPAETSVSSEETRKIIEVKYNTEETTKEKAAETTTSSETKDVSVFTGEDEGVPETMNEDRTPEGSSEAELDSNKSVVYRSYRYTGEEDGTMSYEPYIMVEQNYEKHYVSFYMQFIGVNAYLSPEWDDSLNVLDGEYWIQDFMNADGSEPDLTKVYVKYSPEKIILYYWNATDERFMSEYPQEFVYEP